MGTVATDDENATLRPLTAFALTGNECPDTTVMTERHGIQIGYDWVKG